MTEQIVWAIETECDDDYYGWFVFQLFTSKEVAEEEMKRLAEINKGINYRVVEWELS